MRARTEALPHDRERTPAVDALMRAVLGLFERVVKLSRTLPDDAYTAAVGVEEPGWLADLITSSLPIDVPRRQLFGEDR